MSTNEIIYYNAIFIGNIPDVSDNNLSDIPEEIYSPVLDTNSEKNIYMPVCYLLENTDHYHDCKNMLSSIDYLKYNIFFYQKKFTFLTIKLIYAQKNKLDIYQVFSKNYSFAIVGLLLLVASHANSFSKKRINLFDYLMKI